MENLVSKNRLLCACPWLPAKWAPMLNVVVYPARACVFNLSQGYSKISNSIIKIRLFDLPLANLATCLYIYLSPREHVRIGYITRLKRAGE